MSNDGTKTMAVIGAGTMGRGIAQIFAQSGYDVCMCDALPAALESAMGQINKMLDRAVTKGKMSADDAGAAKEKLHPTANLADMGKRPLIVEAATEKLEVKIDLLRQAQAYLADGGILASNTSSISITQLAAATNRPDRFIGMHFFNPVPLMKLVEVVKGLQTSDETVERTIAIAKKAGGSEERRVGRECRTRWSPFT